MTSRLFILLALLATLLAGPSAGFAQGIEGPAAEITRETQRQLRSFSEQKANVLERIDALAEQPTEKERRSEVDPVFDDLVELRARVHEEFREALVEAKAADEPVREARAALEAARADLEVERSREEQLGGSPVWKERVAAAKAEVAESERELERARAVHEARQERVREYRSHITFFPETISPLLEKISAPKRAEFFAIDDEDNWREATLGVKNGLRTITARAHGRWEQLTSVDTTSTDVWSWLWGLVWRLAVWLALAKLLVPLIPAITEGLLRRRWLRRHATFTINIAELLRALARPLAFFLGMEYVAAYVAQSFAEFEGLVWIIDAVVIYWVVVAAAKVLVLPRSHRRQQGHASASAFDNLDEDEAAAISDLLVIELDRAKKLVRSVRVVVVFWLLSAYIPDFVEPLTGITVIWWLVDKVAVWGFVGVVYWVLSQWKDDIASVFERLAGDGLRRPVEFVHEHKDRPWGVLVIAVASLYVLFKEVGIIARRFVLNTQWFKRASAFAFRTKIELRNRERVQNDGGQPLDAKRLPQDYREVFEDRALVDEAYRIDRGTYTADVLARFERWKAARRQGSVIVSGEPGVGKTTFLNGVSAKLAEATEWPMVRGRIDEKLESREGVLDFVAELFELDTTPSSSDELIAQLNELEPRVALVDDCHHAFTRQIEGFDSLETLLDIVNLCDEAHFFVLTFNGFTWSYINRIEAREHYFGQVLTLEPWSEEDLERMIETRTAHTDYLPSFADLVHDQVDHADYFFEVVKTANGYFRYLHEFSGGNPRVAMLYWLRSLRPTGDAKTLQVSLFRRPSTAEFSSYTDDHWFVLGALAQHGELDVDELATVVNVPRGFCNLAVDYFAEAGVVDLDPESRRARLTPLFLRQVLRQLSNSNFLYGYGNG
ncbi:hypothetical protein FIV42_01440 [Persicimonas caeni]|uniref:ORC1/DEAH AAA+ ATPase domain-containing protein n=1 Tax=Persicimonas caeni TaxID=2292766 RepID=A0A4Y6PMA4_PERCE|nr:AAA family ATPase [Persicimonas caeni]QDG49446.1 hypothetical protein FIV42_01440 [Persicimonas caeni]QED30667.1 AAA family ATPase [Persicimonas caeni]